MKLYCYILSAKIETKDFSKKTNLNLCAIWVSLLFSTCDQEDSYLQNVCIVSCDLIPNIFAIKSK